MGLKDFIAVFSLLDVKPVSLQKKKNDTDQYDENTKG